MDAWLLHEVMGSFGAGLGPCCFISAAGRHSKVEAAGVAGFDDTKDYESACRAMMTALMESKFSN